MVDQLSWSAVGEWLAGFVPEGPLRTAVLLVCGLCVAFAPFIYKYYLGVLAQGAAPGRLSGKTMTGCVRASPGVISRRGSMRNG
jgi:hypothetical protein